MKIREIVNELSFHGRPCTKDCSGHKAGWEWERKHQTNRPTASHPSFNDGVDIAISQRKANKQPIGTNIRGAKGRFQKFQKVKESTLVEYLDKPVSYSWFTQTEDSHRALFVVNEIPFVIDLTKELVNGEDMNVWTTEFKPLTGDNRYGITGKMKEAAATVFATVIQALMEFKQKYPTATLMFTAEEPKRQRLYNKILNSLQKQGFTVQASKSPSGKMGYLVK